MNLTPRVVVSNRRQWTNKHENVRQQITGLYDIWNPDTTSLVDGYKATTEKIQSMIGDAADDGEHLRALGGGWSFSRVAVTKGRLLNTKPLNWMFTISSRNVSPNYAGERTNLLFAQCGTGIMELNDYLKSQRKSLKTTGASNGQTIAGALSTGTHGSAIDVGAIPNYVVGLHLIVGRSRHVWLERESYPVVSNAFVNRLGAELIRDDTLFNAALVSFGSFGVIHGVMLETEPIYLLEAFRQKLPFDSALKNAVETLDFSGVQLPHGSERPYHFQIVFNPFDTKRENVYVTTMYRRPYRDNYRAPDPPSGGLAPGDDALAFIGLISDRVPALIPSLVNGLLEPSYSPYSDVWGTLGEIFTNTTTRGKAASAAVGVPLSEANRALDTVFSVHEAEGPIAAVFSVRFVKGTDALLGFTKFEPTCVLEIDGVFSQRTSDFLRAVWSKFDEEQIPYTFHWGKMNTLNAALVRKMYGTAVDRWQSSRRTLLDAASMQVFSSTFLDRVGLST
jgi:FAD/FMN-containing dehydrogenase